MGAPSLESSDRRMNLTTDLIGPKLRIRGPLPPSFVCVFLTFVLDGGKWLAPRSRRSIPVVLVDGRMLYWAFLTLSYSLTPWSRVLLEKLTDSQPVKKFPAFYGTRRFITAFTSVRHLLLSWTNSIQSMPPHPTSWRSILILFSHLRLGLPSGLFPSGFSTKTLYTTLFFPPPYVLHVPPVSFFSILWREWHWVGSTDHLCSFLHSSVISSLLRPNVLLNALSPNSSTYVPPSMWTTKFYTPTRIF